MLAASNDHFYRLSIGALPMVTGVHPLGVRTNTETGIHLVGYNLPADAKVRVKSGARGELEVPIDRERFRQTRAFKLVVQDDAQFAEQEPNDIGANATAIAIPSVAHGRIARVGDPDLFRFEARAGTPLVLETDAARRGSPVDTRIEVLHPDGRPVARHLLHAVRNTAINFRSVDSNGTGMRLDNYEEMELTEYLYMNGDVMRLFRMPQGPDSDMIMFTSAGKRRAYFDTTAVAHALDEQGFIVEPHPIGTKLPANGLPGLHAALRERRRRRTQAGQRFEGSVHRADQWDVSRARHRHTWSRRRHVRVSTDRTRSDAGFHGEPERSESHRQLPAADKASR
jgi:hypothetical protein